MARQPKQQPTADQVTAAACERLDDLFMCLKELRRQVKSATKPSKVKLPEKHRFGQFIVPHGCRVTGWYRE